jgi:hypothetical protein
MPCIDQEFVEFDPGHLGHVDVGDQASCSLTHGRKLLFMPPSGGGWGCSGSWIGTKAS